MSQSDALQLFQAELEAGLKLTKCQQCGCLENTLKALATALPSSSVADAEAIAGQVSAGLQQMRPVRYACLGCEHCYPAVAQNALIQAFPELDQLAALSCEFQVAAVDWPVVVGEYHVIDRAAPVAVSTLASPALAEALAERQPAGLAIVGKTETENIGLDKVIKNVISNPALRFLILAGLESQGHQTGQSLVALAANGVAESGRIIGASGKRPVLRNVTPAEIEAFRNQVQVIDLIGCEQVDEIAARIESLAQEAPTPACGCSECASVPTATISTTPKLSAVEPAGNIPLDRAGYFVIVPVAEKGLINVEHYAYDNALLRTIDGPTARAIYWTIVQNGWVTELSHAAYLGKELAKAELSLRHHLQYVQDGA
jgi:tetrahydromethanopterin S-methyltransferase subunit A